MIFPAFNQATRSIAAPISGFRVALPGSGQSVPKPRPLSPRAERDSGSAIFAVAKWRIALRASAGLPGYRRCKVQARPSGEFRSVPDHWLRAFGRPQWHPGRWGLPGQRSTRCRGLARGTNTGSAAGRAVRDVRLGRIHGCLEAAAEHCRLLARRFQDRRRQGTLAKPA